VKSSSGIRPRQEVKDAQRYKKYCSCHMQGNKNLGVIRSPLNGVSRQQDVEVDALLRSLPLGFFQLEDDSTNFDNI